jgi:hypothetical protein
VGIFICYRREDSHAAGRLHDSLQQRFSRDQLFLDVDNIEPGETFVEAIQARIASSEVMLVVIGPDWLNARDSKGQRRLEDPNDFVRLEIEAAFKRDIRVIPILLEPAEIPDAETLPSSIRPLAERQAVRLHRASFPRDAEHLNAALAKVVGLTKQPNIQWTAKIVKRSWQYFCVEFSQLSEHHRIEVDRRGFFDKVLLDGTVIHKSVSFTASVRFRVGLHSNQFEVNCREGFMWLKDIQLLIDNRAIFSEK